MKVEIHDYNIGTQSGDALVLVYGDTTNFDDIILNLLWTNTKLATGILHRLKIGWMLKLRT
jgi:hypothetical protein